MEKDMLDDIVFEKENEGELPRRTGLSGVVRQLVREYIEENREYLRETERWEEEFKPYLTESCHFRIPASDRRTKVAVATDN